MNRVRDSLTVDRTKLRKNRVETTLSKMGYGQEDDIDEDHYDT